MNVVGVLARAALYAYPREFRLHFADEMLADIAEGSAPSVTQLFDLLKGGVAMRLDGLARDASYALRRLRAAPLFVAIVVVTFALGIGANVAVFSVLDGVVLRPLPFSNPGRLVALEARDPQGDVFPAVSLSDVSDLRTQTHLAGIAAVNYDQITALVGARPTSLTGLDVMPDYFTILGITPEFGRMLVPADGRPGANTIVISHELWRKDFGANPHLLGHAIRLNDRSVRVVGILRPRQLLADPSGPSIGTQDFLEALPEIGAPKARGARTYGAVARLAPGVTLAGANAELALVSGRLQRLYPHTDARWTFGADSFVGDVLGKASAALWIIFTAVIGILLIACANVGNMLGARWSSRDRELAVRRALGASSRAIAGQLFVETGALAVAGAAVGIGLAFAALHLLGGFMASALPRASSVGINWAGLLYAVGVVVAATLLAGLFPILSLGATDIQSVLKSAGRGGDGSRRHRLRAVLVTVEIAVALALVVVSGLMLRGFVALVHAPLGIRSQGVVTSDDFLLTRPDESAAVSLARQRALLTRLRTLPGVDAAALAMTFPLDDMAMETYVPVFGRTYPKGGAPTVSFNNVSPGYFRTLGIPLTRGRGFTEDDALNSKPVVIVNQAFAARFLGGADPLRERIHVYWGHGSEGSWADIVGVVGSERKSLASSFDPEFYAPLAQAPQPYVSVVAYAPKTDPAVVGREVQAALAQVLPMEQPPNVLTMAQRIADATAQARFATILLGTLGLIALLLALAGVFGVVSFSVTQRLREFGVRMALGATTREVVLDVLRRALATTAIGVAIGLVVAAAAARAIGSQLGGVAPLDPVTFVTAVALIFACAALASLHPAIRATRVQPAEALRYE